MSSTVSDEQQGLLAVLVKENEHIQRENQLLAAFTEKAVAQQQLGAAGVEEQHKKRKASSRRKAEDEGFQPLTEDEKGDLVSQAVEALEAEIDGVRSAGDKDVDDIRTLMEEVDMRINETKNATYEFKRDIIMGGEDAHTGVTSADKIVRFWEDKIYGKEVLLEKVALKNSTYKAAIAKLEAQLAHKEEMGEVLHLVDFDQLKIENQQYMETIDTKNRELLRLKLATGRTAQALNDVKSHLADLEKEGAALDHDVGTRHQELASFERDFAQTQAHAKSVDKTFKQLRTEHCNADQPQTIDYIRLKHMVDDLRKQAADWRRKLELATQQGATKKCNMT